MIFYQHTMFGCVPRMKKSSNLWYCWKGAWHLTTHSCWTFPFHKTQRNSQSRWDMLILQCLDAQPPQSNMEPQQKLWKFKWSIGNRSSWGCMLNVWRLLYLSISQCHILTSMACRTSWNVRIALRRRAAVQRSSTRWFFQDIPWMVYIQALIMW